MVFIFIRGLNQRKNTRETLACFMLERIVAFTPHRGRDLSDNVSFRHAQRVTISLSRLARGISSDFLQAEMDGGIFARKENSEKRDASNIFFSLFGVFLEAEQDAKSEEAADFDARIII